MDRSHSLLSLSSRDAVRATLVDWFAQIKRDLPWRVGKNLYGIWISEIMLQQTSVAAVVPFWHNFMAKFPTVGALAAADESDVLAAWSGLGYYSRARNLHRAAKLICENDAGKLPRTRDQWQALPGVGPYAAGAIASIGLGERVPAMDANARRVIQRWATTNPAELAALTLTARNRLVDGFGADLVPVTDPGVWNEALMELGALVCGAKKAKCEVCPMTAQCGAFHEGWIQDVPPPSKKVASYGVWVGQLVVTWRDQVLLQPPQAPALIEDFPARKVARDNFTDLHPGLWSLPSTVWLHGHEVPQMKSSTWQRRLGLPASALLKDPTLVEVGVVRHAITKYRLKVSVYELALDGRRDLPKSWRPLVGQRQPEPKKCGIFYSEKETLPPISQLARKVLALQRCAFG